MIPGGWSLHNEQSYLCSNQWEQRRRSKGQLSSESLLQRSGPAPSLTLGDGSGGKIKKKTRHYQNQRRKEEERHGSLKALSWFWVSQEINRADVITLYLQMRNWGPQSVSDFFLKATYWAADIRHKIKWLDSKKKTKEERVHWKHSYPPYALLFML